MEQIIPDKNTGKKPLIVRKMEDTDLSFEYSDVGADVWGHESIMLSGYQTEEELIQNMVDAGCAEDTIACFLSCLKKRQKNKGLLLLQEQREMLLDGIHKEQSCIEFLDEVLCRLES